MYKYRRVIIAVIALMLVISMVTGIVVMAVNAKTSDEIQEEIDALQEEAESLAGEREDLEEQIEEKVGESLSVVEQKALVDQEISLLLDEIENVNAQMLQFNQLIAEKQAELDELSAQQTELFQRYALRMRALQERGEITAWSVIFEAESFADMLTRRAMIEEIAASDQRMIAELQVMAADVLEAKDSLAEEKTRLELMREELDTAQVVLEDKRLESEELLTEILSDKDALALEAQKFEDLEAELVEELGQLEVDLAEAKQREWEEEQRRLEEERRKEQERQEQEQGNGGGSGNNGGGNSSSGWMFPLPAGIGVWISSPYGYRVHPITGNYTLHTGVDFAVGAGQPIYATRSGYVTTATYNYVWGNYVVINHMDGYSSLYAHMTNYTVGYGDYVEQGEIIGYVGSTGWSTGAHLHFTIYLNGATVNPMDYVSLR